MKKKPIMFRWMMNPYVTKQHWVGYGTNRTACGITLSGLGGWAAIEGDAIPKCEKCIEIEKGELKR
jgi:hypothetical protein